MTSNELLISFLFQSAEAKGGGARAAASSRAVCAALAANREPPPLGEADGREGQLPIRRTGYPFRERERAATDPPQSNRGGAGESKDGGRRSGRRTRRHAPPLVAGMPEY